MRPRFWHDRWRTGQIGFHQAAVDRSLQRYWPELKIANGSRVIVPLCGKSLDMLWLLQQGHSVVGVEISAVALESFCAENAIPARRRPLELFDVYEAGELRLLRGDFFAATAQLLGPVSAVYDRAALISWAPQMRQAYVAHITALTDAATKTLLIALEYPQEQMNGPPFSLGAHDVEELYGRAYEIRELARNDILASEPRLRSRGVTQLHEVCYLLTRL